MKSRPCKAVILPRDHLKRTEISLVDQEDHVPPHTLPLPETLVNRLYDHQRFGLDWLFRANRENTGAILGDDMGLGKTFQVACLLCGLFIDREINRVLIVCPVSVIQSWSREMTDHINPYISNLRIHLVTSDIAKKKRESSLREIFKGHQQSIVITSYNLLSNMIEDFDLGSWDYVVLDEGHTIKNPKTKMSRAAQTLRSTHRLLLTGTPVQNNLMELYTLVNWATNGKNVLGSKKEFSLKYVFPIEDGQNPNSTNQELEKSQRAAHQLRQILKPILLQRKKNDFEKKLKLPEKIEVTVWIPLSRKQREIYSSFLRSSQMTLVMTKSIYPISAINYLKTLSRHPFLLEASDVIKSKKEGSELEDLESITSAMKSMNIESSSTFAGACEKISQGTLSHQTLNHFERLEEMESKDSPQDQVTETRKLILDEDCVFDDSNVFGIVGRTPTTTELLENSIKLDVCVQLIRMLRREDHRILVFSQSKFMLDIIQRVLADLGIGSSRIDGSVCGKDRQRVIDSMNDMSHSIDVCLLTTRACGFGITLTGADRVIIFDPSWNPAEDRQAVDRAYRIGQTRDVVVYRLILAGSLEQEMYKREVFKDGIRVASERETDRSDQYFCGDPQTLFDLDQPLVMNELRNRESQIDSTNPLLKYPEEIKRQTFTGVLGFTKHDILYANPPASEDIQKIASESFSPKEETVQDSPFDKEYSEDTSSVDPINDLMDSSDSEEEDLHKKYHRLKRQVNPIVIDLSNSSPSRQVDLTKVSEEFEIENTDLNLHHSPVRPLHSAEKLLISNNSFPKLAILRPMSKSVAENYNIAISRGHDSESKGKILTAAKHYLEALELSDVDVALHRKLSDLKQKLEEDT